MEEKLTKLRHTASHILAQAICRLFPDVKLGIGPATEEGFYYDFEFSQPISEKDLPKIENEMRKIVQENLPIEKQTLTISEAKKLFKNQPYKRELLDEFEKENTKEVSVYSQGEFTDLCAGPHLKSTGQLKAFKLLSLAGAYWRGSEKNKMLTRIYGTAFATEKELEDYLLKIQEAQKYDHRLLGERLELFIIPSEIGGGLPIWLPKGAVLRQIVEDFWKKEHQQAGYSYVYTPHIAHSRLWEISGHLSFYRENMYSEIEIDQEKYLLKPMNCPLHIFVYNQKMRSYRDLPLKLCELGTVYRYERSGTLHGLTRVRGFTQDDAHIFTTKENIQKEVEEVLDLALKILKKFGFEEYEIELSVRDMKNKDKYLGDENIWQTAETALEKALLSHNLSYRRAEGEAVFYGPKIDLKIKDALGRPWQCTTIQIDFNLPEKFDLFYIDQSGKKQRPVLIHRAIFGSLERFIGVLLEHHKGNLPIWLSPIQVKIINVSESHIKYAQKVAETLRQENIRVETDFENKSVAKKIREASLKKIPYIVVIGDKEVKENILAVRDQEGKTNSETIEQLIAKIKESKNK
jgi:threonyl-tRNA synthetase